MWSAAPLGFDATFRLAPMSDFVAGAAEPTGAFATAEAYGGYLGVVLGAIGFFPMDGGNEGCTAAVDAVTGGGAGDAEAAAAVAA
jgi:hypothetical protein